MTTNPNKSPSPLSKRFLIFLFSMGILVGALSTVYYEAKLKVIPRKAFSTQEIAKTNRLNRLLNQKESENVSLEAEIALLNKRLDNKRLEKLPSATVSPVSNPDPMELSPAQPRVSIETLSQLSGLSPLSGYGLEIRLEDAKSPVFTQNTQKQENPNLGIIHNQDLLALINQLWANGATGIAINNQRLSSQSAINCAGPVITINNTRITAPFTIQVLGNKPMLLKALRAKESYVKYLSSYGINTMISAKEMTLPASTLVRNVSSLHSKP
jgi:uncharacterized protein YlxW (UPF0749 family)